MAGTHSRLSPSSSDRWLNCPGSVALCENVEDISGRDAAHGTAAHWLIEQLVGNGEGESVSWLGHLIHVEIETGNVRDDLPKDPAEITPAEREKLFTFEVDAEMIKAADEWLRCVYELEADKLLTEVKLDLGDFMPGQSGTSDLVAIKGSTLHVFDFKYGRGVIVSANCNQLKIYALGAIDALSSVYDFETVVLHIVQPRAFHYDRFETDVESLEEYREYVRERAALTYEPDAPLAYSEKGCKWCPVRNSCSVRGDALSSMMAEAFPILDNKSAPAVVGDSTPPAAPTMTEAEIAVVCTVADEVRAWLKDVEAEALERIKRGEQVPGFKAVKGRGGNRTWTDEEKAAEALKRKKLKLDEYMPRKLVSPAQAEKLFPGKKADFLREFYAQSEGSATLARDDDKRPALEFKKPAESFPDLVAEENGIRINANARSVFDAQDDTYRAPRTAPEPTPAEPKKDPLALQNFDTALAGARSSKRTTKRSDKNDWLN